MRSFYVLLLIAAAVNAIPVQRYEEEEIRIPVQVIEYSEPMETVPIFQNKNTILSVQEVEEPEPIAISNEIVAPRDDVQLLKETVQPLKEEILKKDIEKQIKKDIQKQKDKLREENKLKTISEEKKEEKVEKTEDEQRKDDQLQVETVQDEQMVKKILPAPETVKTEEVEGEITSEVKQLTPAEIDVNVAPESENGVRQGPPPQGLPTTTNTSPPPNPIQQFIQNPLQSIQSVFTGQQSTPAAASDANAGTTQPPNFLSQVQQSISSGIQGFQQQLQGLQNSVASAFNLPTAQTQQQQAQADTPVDNQTTARPGFNPIQSIQTAITNFGQTLTGQQQQQQQDGQVQQQQQQQTQQPPANQGPLSGILNLFSPTRPPTTLTPVPVASQLVASSTAVPFDPVNPQRDPIGYDSVESSEETGVISVVRDTEKDATPPRSGEAQDKDEDDKKKD